LIDRIVDYWLTSSTERAYQQPFAQVVALLGETVMHVSSHGVGEQGKDIITRRHDGTFKAYQLKSGDINKAVWNKIHGEITELIELPIQYPEVPKGQHHTSVLVTNGCITADVRLSVQAMNAGNEARGFPQLQVIERPALSKMFVDAHGRFLPFALPDLKRFLDLFNSDGRANLNKGDFATYVSALLDVPLAARPRDAARQIASATLLAGYLTTPYVHAQNHVAICEAWVITLATMHRALLRAQLDVSAVGPTHQLISDAVLRELGDLAAEFGTRDGNFIEGSPMGDGGIMYTVRVTIVLGWLATYHLIRRRRDRSYVYPRSFVDLLADNLKHVTIWGEYAVPYLYAIASFWRSAGDHATADSLCASILATVVQQNNAMQRAGLPSPYLTPDDLLASYLGMPGRQIDMTEFSGSSYTVRSLVDVLVLRGRRDLLEQLWPLVTETRSIEYYPDDSCDFLSWQSENGTEKDYGYPRPTSYADLQRNLPTDSLIPAPLRSGTELALPFVLTFPHRFRRDLLIDMVRHGY
jgi:hypothetical protein